MRALTSIVFAGLFSSSAAFASEAPVRHYEQIDYQRDLAVLCELSKLAGALRKTKEFSEPARLTVLISTLMEAGVTTTDTKKALVAVSVSEPKMKATFLKEYARDIGVKNWKCPTIEDLFSR